MNEPKKKNKVGPPNKATQIKNKLERLENDYKDGKLRGDQLIVSNYQKYLGVLNDAALGRLKGQTTTNQISCAKILIDKIEKDFKEDEVEKEIGAGMATQTETVEVDTGSLISLKAV